MCIMGKAILYTFLTVLWPMVVALQGDIQLGNPVTLPCQDDYSRNTPTDLLDIQWRTGEELVLQSQFGKIIQGHRYINRTYFSAEGLRNRDFSLSITHTEYSDSGQYQCVLIKDGQEVTLEKVELELEVPRSQSNLFVESGQKVILSCFSRVDWSGSEAAFIQWKRWSQVVLQWKSGSLYVDPVFEGRVSVPKERILHGDISLIFNKAHQDDQGYYVCFCKNNDDIRPLTIINLTISEQMSTVEKSGSQFELLLPDESPMTLNFLPDRGNYTITVCEVQKQQLTCDRHYSERILLQNNSLILTNITSADSGTFFLRDKSTGRTRNVLIVQIFTLGINVTSAETLIAILAVSGVAGFFFLVGSAYSGWLCNKNRKLKRFPEAEENRENEAEKGCEMLHFQSVDIISHESSVSSIKSSVI